MALKKTIRISKKQKILIVIAAVVIIFCSWWIWGQFAPKPLGDKLEYLGKRDYGCYLLCDSKPASTYYYATDMNTTEVIEYFRESSLEQNPETTDGETYFGIKTTDSETIYMYYYADKNTVLKDNAYLKKSSKAHILSVPSFKYQAAKDSL